MYQVHGLNLASAIALPELACHSVDPSRDADATIVTGNVPCTIPHQWASEEGFQVGRDDVLIGIEGVGRYLVQRGQRIVVQPARGAPREIVRVFLYGAGFSTLLQQRRLSPLHASAVVVEGAGDRICRGHRSR